MKRGIARGQGTMKIRMIFTISQVRNMVQLFIDLLRFRPFR